MFHDPQAFERVSRKMRKAIRPGAHEAAPALADLIRRIDAALASKDADARKA